MDRRCVLTWRQRIGISNGVFSWLRDYAPTFRILMLLYSRQQEVLDGGGGVSVVS